MPFWLQLILTWIAIGGVLNLIMFKVYYRKWISNLTDNNEYILGYKHAQTNISMYYAIYDVHPTAIWVNNVRGSCLDTREKILASTNI